MTKSLISGIPVVGCYMRSGTLMPRSFMPDSMTRAVCELSLSLSERTAVSVSLSIEQS